MNGNNENTGYPVFLLNIVYEVVNNMELWDLYDRNRNKLNKDHIRGEKLSKGEYHLVVHVWIKNDKNEYLISQRSQNKKYPLFWECVGGSVIKDETTYDAAIRETFEEVGVDLKNSDFSLITTFIRDEYQDIVDVYEFNYNGEPSLELATTDEVIDVKWMKKEEIATLYKQGKLMKTLKYYL